MDRQYTGEDNELGWEKSVDDYISNILKITNECHEHMAPTGSMFINVGDSFKNNGGTLVPERLTIALNDCKLRNCQATMNWGSDVEYALGYACTLASGRKPASFYTTLYSLIPVCNRWAVDLIWLPSSLFQSRNNQDHLTSMSVESR